MLASTSASTFGVKVLLMQRAIRHGVYLLSALCSVSLCLFTNELRFNRRHKLKVNYFHVFAEVCVFVWLCVFMCMCSVLLHILLQFIEVQLIFCDKQSHAGFNRNIRLVFIRNRKYYK